jgi:hypothetical protein
MPASVVVGLRLSFFMVLPPAYFIFPVYTVNEHN